MYQISSPAQYAAPTSVHHLMHAPCCKNTASVVLCERTRRTPRCSAVHDIYGNRRWTQQDNGFERRTHSPSSLLKHVPVYLLATCAYLGLTGHFVPASLSGCPSSHSHGPSNSIPSHSRRLPRVMPIHAWHQRDDAQMRIFC